MKEEFKAKVKKTTPYILIFLGLGVFIFVMFWIIDSFLLPSMVHSKNTVIVPDVTGKTLTDAEKLLNDKNLKISKVTEQFSNTASAGTVLMQVPKGGEEIKTDRHIYLTVSKGEQNLIMPNLIGQPLRNARVNILNMGLKVGNVSFTFDERYGGDTIVRQSVPAGLKVGFNTAVDIVVSKGSESLVKVPNIMHIDFSEVEAILGESELVLGKVSKKDGSGTFLPNTVIEQNPEPGSLVAKKTAVSITITK